MVCWLLVVGEEPHLLRPLLGLSLRRSKERGVVVVDEHGVAVCCVLR
jgi:hypothetical protein